MSSVLSLMRHNAPQAHTREKENNTPHHKLLHTVDADERASAISKQKLHDALVSALGRVV
jgi:hypothetical protein